MVTGFPFQCFLSSLICFIMFVTRYHKWFIGNAVSLLKLWGGARSQWASITKWSMQPVTLAYIIVSLKN